MRPTVEVVITNVALPYLLDITAGMRLNGTIKEEARLHQIEEDYYMVTKVPKYSDDYTVQNVLSCLKDHMDNVAIADWAKPNGDLVVSQVDEDDLYLSRWVGRYHGPKIDVKVTYYEA
jgi:hypothetical protein